MSKNFIKVFITITAILSICFSFTISSFAYNDYEIFFYDGTTITQLTDNYYFDGEQQINNSGEVVWRGNNKIYFYDGMNITRLSKNDYSARSPQINDSGEVVWSATKLESNSGSGGGGGGG